MRARAHLEVDDPPVAVGSSSAWLRWRAISAMRSPSRCRSTSRTSTRVGLNALNLLFHIVFHPRTFCRNSIGAHVHAHARARISLCVCICGVHFHDAFVYPIALTVATAPMHDFTTTRTQHSRKARHSNRFSIGGVCGGGHCDSP